MNTAVEQAVEQTVLRHAMPRKTEEEKIALKKAKLQYNSLCKNRKHIVNVNREEVAKIIINHRRPEWWKFYNISLKDCCTIKIMK